MKLKSFLLILIFSLASRQFKASDITVTLTPTSALSGIKFSSLKIIDDRIFKGNIGYVTRGKLVPNNKKIVFPEKFETYMEKTLNILLPKKKESNNLVLIFKRFTVSEKIGTLNQYGFFNIEIEFARQVDTLLYSLGTFNANISANNSRVKYTHAERILKGLVVCFRKFDKTEWKSNQGILIEKHHETISYDYKSVLPKGVYLNYRQMIKKSPLDSINFEIKQVKQSKRYVAYEIDFKGKINSDLVNFVSDGTTIYIHANRNHFLKSKCYGKYIYFQGKVPIPTNTNNATLFPINDKITASVIGGALIVGFIFYLLPNENQSWRSIIG